MSIAETDRPVCFPIVQQRSSVTRNRILDTARELFLARNFGEVTVDQVAEGAETTKGGVYHHFGSKDALYLAMLHRDLEQKAALFARAVEMEGDVRTRLRKLTRDYFKLPLRQREAITLIRRDINRFHGKERKALVRAYQKALPGQVETILHDGIRDGDLPACDARLLSWSFVALVEISLSPHAGRIFPGTDAKLDHVLHLFFDGAAASAQAVPAKRKVS